MQSPPSVCPSPYLLLNHWTKANQIAHMNGACKATFFWPHPLGPSGGAKRSNIIKFQLQCQFQRFFNQTLCVFSRKKGIKHIRQDFHLATWVMPQGWDFGVPWGVGGCFGGSKKLFSEIQPDFVCVCYLHEWHMHWCHFLGSRPLGPWGGAKRSNIIKSELQSQFQRFLNQTLCILSQKI